MRIRSNGPANETRKHLKNNSALQQAQGTSERLSLPVTLFIEMKFDNLLLV